MSRNHPPEIDQRSSLTPQLKAKSRERREGLALLAAPGAAPRLPRNDVLPDFVREDIPLDELRIPARKLRRVDPAHVREVAGSIGALGFCVPVLVGKNNIVIDGMIRIEAARLLGLPRVPCLRIGHLSDDQQRLLRLAANRLAEKGQWDLDELRVEFEELIQIDESIEVTGFSEAEIDQILLPDDDLAIELGPLEPQAGADAVARLGDMFQLGPHRIVCGDATDPETLRHLMDSDGHARLLLTDEPYNVKISGNVTGGDHREFPMASGEMSDDEFLRFNIGWMKAALPFLCDGAAFGSFIDWRGYPTVHTAASSLGLTPLNLVVWGKTNAGMGSLYRSQHELLPLFRVGTAAPVNNVKLGKSGRWRSNLWTYPGASSLGSDARRGLKDHPTVKPSAMLADALLDLTQRGDIVLDPFLGSGSTLIAAEKTDRICRGVELDPLYVDVVIRRWEAQSGACAMLIETGERFADLVERRRREMAGEHAGEDDAANVRGATVHDAAHALNGEA